jgi:hypothetical protein
MISDFYFVFLTVHVMSSLWSFHLPDRTRHLPDLKLKIISVQIYSHLLLQYKEVVIVFLIINHIKGTISRYFLLLDSHKRNPVITPPNWYSKAIFECGFNSNRCIRRPPPPPDLTHDVPSHSIDPAMCSTPHRIELTKWWNPYGIDPAVFPPHTTGTVQ